ncbi:MAG: hypothetical protein NZV14_07510 [Bryobacteraceae bacterium]|nr:hypothetical protein [Bryobacteraceae bacterium]MDW8377992.1 hypothetical protein [Bryobacterales bacterium]
MAVSNQPQKDIKEYAGGWITEREHTSVPSFLKLAYVCIALGTVGYCILYRNGEIQHPDRGALVREFNSATATADTLMYLVAALAALFFAAVIAFAFRKMED